VIEGAPANGDQNPSARSDAKTGTSRDTRRRFEQWARNPTCEANTLSAVHNVTMADVAKADGIEATFGQSPFALARGQRFERLLYRAGGALLFEALRSARVVPASATGLADFRIRVNGGPFRNLDQSLAGTRDLLRNLAVEGSNASEPWLVAGATVRIPGGVMLPEAILVLDALIVDHSRSPRELIVGEIKTYPDRGGYTDTLELATARAQAGVYVHGLELVLQELELSDAFRVSDRGFLVLSRPGSNRPSVRAGEDLRYQARRAERGFALLRVAAEGLPRGSGHADVDAIRSAGFEYCETCVTFCDRASICREKALEAGNGAVLGEDVARFLGSVTLPRALELAAGAAPSKSGEVDLVRRIRDAEALRIFP
jgi:hypothetical protein